MMTDEIWDNHGQYGGPIFGQFVVICGRGDSDQRGYLNLKLFSDKISDSFYVYVLYRF